MPSGISSLGSSIPLPISPVLKSSDMKSIAVNPSGEPPSLGDDFSYLFTSSISMALSCRIQTIYVTSNLIYPCWEQSHE